MSACQVDASALLAAVAAYQATKGRYPAPPAPWSATTYRGNYTPLTAAGSPGPYLKAAPSDVDYVLEYDGSGHVWVEPPGRYDQAYNPANDATSGAACTRVVR